MRTLPLLAALMMTVALASLAPTTAGMTLACTELSGSCPGIACVDANRDQRWGYEECVGSNCHFQSDCCSYADFWCPEDD